MMRVTIGRSALVWVIRGYQWFLSPMKVLFFGPTAHCRFFPCCSEYAIQAIQEHGVIRGGGLALIRICRCHPWGGCGHDPVPGTKEGAGDERFSGSRDDSDGSKTTPKARWWGMIAHWRAGLVDGKNAKSQLGLTSPGRL